MTMALPGGRPWQTPTGCVVRCDEVLVGRGAPLTVPGLADDDVALYDEWARITIVEPAAGACTSGCIAAPSSPSAARSGASC